MRNFLHRYWSKIPNEEIIQREERIGTLTFRKMDYEAAKNIKKKYLKREGEEPGENSIKHSQGGERIWGQQVEFSFQRRMRSNTTFKRLNQFNII